VKDQQKQRKKEKIMMMTTGAYAYKSRFRIGISEIYPDYPTLSRNQSCENICAHTLGKSPAKCSQNGILCRERVLRKDMNYYEENSNSSSGSILMTCLMLEVWDKIDLFTVLCIIPSTCKTWQKWIHSWKDLWVFASQSQSIKIRICCFSI
jgi:hypothetical protein